MSDLSIFGDIIEILAGKFDDPATRIKADVTAMLADLASRGFLTDLRETTT